ncbi:MAG TPA: DUF2752 domain-containing protein [Pyrinomonadaceae bacterium]|jgi:hypothetical protein
MITVKSSIYERISAAAGVSAIAAGSAFVWHYNPSSVNFFPVCPLYAMTGLACPGCGLTRGFHALFHGDVVSALDYNALLPVFAFIFGYFLLAMFLIAVRGRGLSFEIFRPRFLYGFLISALVFAVVRNLPIYPFSVLYP